MKFAPELLKQRISESVSTLQALLDDRALHEELLGLAGDVTQALRNGNTVFFAGNGGSFADALHLAAELVGRFVMERNPLPSVALGANGSIMSAVGNDYGFDDVFRREIAGLGKPGDVFIGISTSGNSPNVLKAAQAAREMGLSVWSMTGASSGKLGTEGRVLAMPATVTARIQEAHIVLGHILCEIVEQELFG